MSPDPGRLVRRAVACFLLFGFVGCSGPAEVQVKPDEEFGHRYEGIAPDGRATHLISPPDSNISYLYYPAVYDTVHVRQLVGEPNDSQVEVLIKGSFPDSCTELDAVEQHRAEHIVTVNLQMRKPRGTVCASVMRPYRFYVILDGTFDDGNYTLKVNDRAHNFVLRPETDA
jgi:hypothetical protein